MFLDKLGLGVRRAALRAIAVGLGLAACGTLSGCAGFFVYPGSTTTSTGTGTSSTADYAYVSNSSSGSTYLNGYVMSSGTLVATTGSPVPLGYVPSAMAISQNNGFLYIASDSTLASGVGYLYGYSIGSGGQLSILSGGPLENESISSMDISPDGQWLFTLDTNGVTLEEYQILSSGLLKYEATYTITGAATGVVTPASVKVAPSGDFIVCALGTGGMVTFPFDTTTGEAGPGDSLVSPGTASEGIYTMAVDKNNNIYAAGTVGLQVFTATTAGVPTLQNSTAYATDAGTASSMVLNTGYSYVYTANTGNQTTSATITEDSIATGPALTALTGSPLTGPTTVSALARDNSGKYILAAGYGATSGVQLFTIGSTGALTESGSAPTGTNLLIPTVMAVTH